MKISVQLLLILASSTITISSPIPESGDSSRIVNGYAVDISNVPYQASLRRRVFSGWSHMCGAAIISVQGILTAAHCVESTEPASIRVVVGTSSRNIGGTTYDVSMIIVHEKYSSSTMQHDIALVGTAKKISFSSTVQPVAIPHQGLNFSSGTEALVSGFGVTSYEGTVSAVLRAATVKIVQQETCARAYLRIATIYSGMICAGATDPPRDACQGDSGGPMVSSGYLIGLVSWGEECARSEYPGVYTRVSEYYSWIYQNVAKI